MDRRNFIRISAASLAGLALGTGHTTAEAAGKKKRARKPDGRYNLILLGDTHYDTAPDTVYHTGYSDPNPTRDAAHRKEFGRNADMWSDRSLRLVKRAGRLVDDRTAFAIQSGDLIQGDTGSASVHKMMLDDALGVLKESFGTLPLLTVMGNHDMRGLSDEVSRQAYLEFMPERLSKETGEKITDMTFAKWVGPDVFIFIEFNRPDDALIDKLLDETAGARYTFIVLHCPVFPYDSTKYFNWILHGRDNKTEARRHFIKRFAQRNAIVICGHSHTTELTDWTSEDGRITQMTINSVWSKPELGTYDVDAKGADEYGILRIKSAEKEGKKVPQSEIDWFDEYRPGLKRYTHSPAAGSYKLNVDEKGVTVDFYAGDSETVSETFKLR